MEIKIRKENFGYVLFDSASREHYFIETKLNLENKTPDAIISFLGQYFKNAKEKYDYCFIDRSDSVLRLSAPIAMYMEISRECNLNCGHCYKPENEPAQLPSIDCYFKVINELTDMGVLEIRICGNEPGISPYLLPVISFIKKKGLYLGVNTNAFYGDDRQQQIIDSEPNFLAISIDGTEKTHDAMRKPGSYERALVMLKKAHKKISIKRRINTVLTKLTMNTIEHVVEIGYKYDAEVSFLPFRPIGKDIQFNKKYAINREIMFESVKEVVRLRNIFSDMVIYTYFDILGEKAQYHHSLMFSWPCPARKNGFIEYNGDFYPCDFLRYLSENFYCGNVFRRSFREIWKKSEPLRKFQNYYRKKCDKCGFYMKTCYGGCISGSLAMSGKPDDELCFVDLMA